MRVGSFSSSYNMKKIIFTILGLFALVPVFSQNIREDWTFKPKDTWPFLYEDFRKGLVCSSSGETLINAEINVSVLDQKLYYLQGETIMMADMVRLFSARIGGDVFVNIGGKMYLVLAESEGGAAIRSACIDEDKMNQANLGYVSSPVAAARNVSGIALESGVGTNINKSIAAKEGGDEIPVLNKLYILYNRNRIVPALKREVMAIPGLDKNEAKAFFSSHKIKWTQPSSLTEVADFLTEHLN